MRIAVNYAERFKNITVYELLQIVFFIFIGYAAMDVFSKIKEHAHYDMQALLLDIQKEYPKSTLTFQNIRIEGNYAKTSYSENGAKETYYESTTVYIEDNQLKKEYNFLWVLCVFPLLLFLSIFHQDPRTLQIKKLGKVSFHTCAWMAGSLFISIVIHFSYTDDYEYRNFTAPNQFKNKTTSLLHRIDVSDYKK